MTTNHSTNAYGRQMTAEPACMLRWVFQRGPETLTCAIENAGDRGSYDLCVLPHWDLSLATVEHFEASVNALQRHAAIAAALRHAGWRVNYGARDAARVAA